MSTSGADRVAAPAQVTGTVHMDQHPNTQELANIQVDAQRVPGQRTSPALPLSHDFPAVPLSPSASSMLEECRKELSSLRAVVKGATSHKAWSLRLLTESSEVMVKLDDIVYNRTLQSADREQLIHRVGHRALMAMDRAEGVVQRYGHGSALRKMFQTSETVKAKFEDAIEELEKVIQVADAGTLLGMQMMLSGQMMDASNVSPRHGSLPTSDRTPSSTTYTTYTTQKTDGENSNNGRNYINDGTLGIDNSKVGSPLANQPAANLIAVGAAENAAMLTAHMDQNVGISVSPTENAHKPVHMHPSGHLEPTILGVAPSASGAVVMDQKHPINQHAANVAIPTIPTIPTTLGTTASRTVSRADTLLSNSNNNSTILSKTDGISIVTEYEHKELFRGSKQAFLEAGASVELEATNEDDEGGDGSVLSSYLWIYSSKILGPDRMQAFNMVDGSRQTIQTDRGAVTVMHYDSRGVLWTGHKSGHVTAWNVHSRKPYCKSVRVSSGQIKAVTSDEAGTAWVGSDKGDVRRVALTEQTLDSEVIGYELVVTGQLKHSGSGTPDISASHPVDANGMVINLRAKEKAHNGPVTAILAAAGRVWTSGGSPAFVCFKEWTQRGEFMNKRDLKVTGTATCMKIVSPFVAVRTGLPSDQLADGRRKASQADVRQQYQVLTGYANGTIGVWGPVNGILCQFIRIGRHLAPITSMAVLNDMGMVATAHIDGKIRLRVPPRIVDKDRLSVSYSDQSVYSVNLNLIELVASKSGDSIMGVYAHKNGLSYATAAAKTVFVSNDTLADIVIQSGSKILRDMGNKLSSCSPEWASKNMSESYSEDVRGGDESFNQMKSTMLFPQDAFQWMIDFADLTQTRVIGEGAFGKVYLGKWHETDVAIKALTSLGALGITAGQIASYATETDVKDALKTLEREVGLMVGMRHPNVILFLGVCPDPPCVVTEYCARGSLYDVLVEAKDRPNGELARALTWYRRVSMMLDAAKGMLYLHSHRPTIIHRDLKSPNLLVDGNWNVKVTDFNLSRLADVSQPGVASSVVANNPRWHAPEIIRDAHFTKPGDVYAFGLIMWEMITWMLPYDSMSSFQMILFVGDKGGRPPVPESNTGTASVGNSHWHIQGGSFPGYNAYVDLMVRCWDQDPEKRPAFPEIIARLREILLSSFSESDTIPLQDVSSERNNSTDDSFPSSNVMSSGIPSQTPNLTLTDGESGNNSPSFALSPPAHPPSPFVDTVAVTSGALQGATSGPATGVTMAVPNPFDMSAGPFGAPTSATHSHAASLPSLAPTIPTPSPFDAVQSGDIPEVELETRASSGMHRRASGGRRGRPVIDSVMEATDGRHVSRGGGNDR